MSGHRTRAAVRRTTAWLIGAAVLLTGSSCSSPQKDIAMSAGTGTSAVQTVRLTLTALDNEDLTSTAAEVTVTDALSELSKAQSQLGAVAPTTPRDADRLAQVGAALDQAMAAVKNAQLALDGFSGAPSRREASKAVAAALHELQAVEKKAGSPR
jgi:hypothetical protein